MMWRSLCCTYEGWPQVSYTESTDGTRICLFTGWNMEHKDGVDELAVTVLWINAVTAVSLIITSLLACATVTGWEVPHIYCLHLQHEAVQAEFFLDFLTLKKAMHSLKHHKLLTQQQSVTSDLPYILWAYLHWLKHYPIKVKLYGITLQSVILENI
jgi:hypothetical protein